jgi:hypothetical protein
LHIHVFFGGKLQKSKMVHCMDFLPLPLSLKDNFKWKWSSQGYCSRVISPCTMHFWNLQKHLIFINQTKHGLARWLVEHIYTLIITKLKGFNHNSPFQDPNSLSLQNFLSFITQISSK